VGSKARDEDGLDRAGETIGEAIACKTMTMLES